jgi:hypothetical protein
MIEEVDVSGIIAWHEHETDSMRRRAGDKQGIYSSPYFSQSIPSIYKDIKELEKMKDPQACMCRTPPEVLRIVNEVIYMLNNLLKLDYYEQKNDLAVGEKFRRIKEKIESVRLKDLIQSGQKFSFAGKPELDKVISLLKGLLPDVLELEKLEVKDVSLTKQGMAIVSKKRLLGESGHTILGKLNIAIAIYKPKIQASDTMSDINISRLRNAKYSLRSIKRNESYLAQHIEYVVHLLHQRFSPQTKALLKEYEEYRAKPSYGKQRIEILEENFLKTYAEVCRLL